jgi:hypothetical protein
VQAEVVAEHGTGLDLDDDDDPQATNRAGLVAAVRRWDGHDHARVELVGVALHPLEHAQQRPVGAVAGARLALGLLATEQLPLAPWVLVHDLVDELADADVAQLLDVEGPLASRLEAGRAQLLDEPGEQLLLGALRSGELRHLADDLLAEPGLDVGAAR